MQGITGNEYLFIRGIDNLKLALNLKIYIEEVIMG